MSESSKMGLLGSKEEGNKKKNNEFNKEESPERYIPYSADSDSETYDTEALSIMDINDIIGVQSEPVGDSTLESEFAALSEIITDSQPDSTGEKVANKNLDAQSSTSTVTANVVDSKNSSEIVDKNHEIAGKNNSCAKTLSNQVSSDISIVTDNKNQHSDVVNTPKVEKVTRLGETAEVITEIQVNTQCDQIKTESINKDEQKGKNGEESVHKISNKDPTDGGGINKSLQLIGEAYISDDSQEIDTDEIEQIGKEPKIVFSCKPLVDKHLDKFSTNDSTEIKENRSHVIENDVDVSESCVESVSKSSVDDVQTSGVVESTTKSMEIIESKMADSENIESKITSLQNAELKTASSENMELEETSPEHVEAKISSQNIESKTASPENMILEQTESKSSSVNMELDETPSEQAELKSAPENMELDETPSEQAELKPSIENIVLGETPSEQAELKPSTENMVLDETPSEHAQSKTSSENMELKTSPEETESTSLETLTPKIILPENSESIVENNDSQSNDNNSTSVVNEVTNLELATIPSPNESNKDVDEPDDNKMEVDEIKITPEVDGPVKLADVAGDRSEEASEDKDTPKEVDNQTTVENKLEVEKIAEIQEQPILVEVQEQVTKADEEQNTEVDKEQKTEANESMKIEANEDLKIEPNEELQSVINEEHQIEATEELAAEVNEELKSDVNEHKKTEADDESKIVENQEEKIQPIEEEKMNANEEPSTEDIEEKTAVNEEQKTIEIEEPNPEKNENNQINETEKKIEEVQLTKAEVNDDDLITTIEREESTEIIQSQLNITSDSNLVDDESIDNKSKVANDKSSSDNKEAVEIISAEPDTCKSDLSAPIVNNTDNQDTSTLSTLQNNDEIMEDEKMEVDETQNSLTEKNGKSEEILKESVNTVVNEEIAKMEQDASEVKEETPLVDIDVKNDDESTRKCERLKETVISTSDEESKQAIDEINKDDDGNAKISVPDNSEKLALDVSSERIDEEVTEQKSTTVEISSEDVTMQDSTNIETADLNEEISQTDKCQLALSNEVASIEPTTIVSDENTVFEVTQKSVEKQIKEKVIEKQDEEKANMESETEVCEDKPEVAVEIIEKDKEKKTNVTESINKKDQDDIIDSILESTEKSSKLVVDSESLPTNLNEHIHTIEENLVEKTVEDTENAEIQGKDPFDELLELDLMSNENSMEKTSETSQDNRIVTETLISENKEDVSLPENLPLESLLSEEIVQEPLEPVEESGILNDVMNILDKPDDIPMDIEEQKGDEVVNEIAESITEKPSEDLNKCENSSEAKESESETANEQIEEKLDQDSVLQTTVGDSDIQNTISALEDQQFTEIPLIEEDENASETPEITDPLTQADSGIEVIQTNPEISELESAVKFLQESEENEIESPVILSPKIMDSSMSLTEKKDSPNLFPSSQEICEDSADLAAELDTITSQDSIAISEAEIINEAAKLENEKKQLSEAQITVKEHKNLEDGKITDETPSNLVEESKLRKLSPSSAKATSESKNDPSDVKIEPTENILPTKITIPKISILEERLKEPPKIEIPVVEPRISSTLTSPKTSLLIQRDAKVMSYEKMMDSPKILSEKGRDETKSSESSSKKEGDKHDYESHPGSPRIILKIAKSAIADCSEPKSPKSPKIRSVTSSPNPEDSPGQKLGKIKLKLSKGCHPAIINENNEEPTLQWHTESSSSLSPLGMKIKLSKTGDASIVQPEKFDNQEDKRLDSPLGMKIKLSKSGDASIVPQEVKEVKHKPDLIPGSPKRTESPLGVKIKLSKTGDASIIQSDKHESECKPDKETKNKERSEINQDAAKRTDSPLGMKIKLFKTGDASILHTDNEEGSSSKNKEKAESNQENIKRADSTMGMKIKLSKKGNGATIVTPDVGGSDTSATDKLEVQEISKSNESPLGMKIKLSKTGDASIIYPEGVNDQHKNQDKEDPESSEAVSSSDSSSSKDLESSSTESDKKSESPIGMKIKLNKDGDATIVHQDKQKSEQDTKRTESPIGMKIKLSKTGDASIVQPQSSEIQQDRENVVSHGSGDSTSVVDTIKIKMSKTDHPSIIINDNNTVKIDECSIVSHTVQNNTEVTISPVKIYKKSESSTEIAAKRKDITISPIEPKKSKVECQITQILPDVTIQKVESVKFPNIPHVVVVPHAYERPEVEAINQEISLTPIDINKLVDNSVGEKFKNILAQPNNQNNSSDDCEIIEHRPELIIVNENSNSSQDVMIIDEVSPPPKIHPEIKLPKKRGRPRRNPLAFTPIPEPVPQDPLAIDEPAVTLGPKENERPKRTCRSLKSYAPPKRGRGRGRGKRKFERIERESTVAKRPRLEKSLTEIENSTTALITLDEETPSAVQNESPELYKALKQPSRVNAKEKVAQSPAKCTVDLSESNVDTLIDSRVVTRIENDSTTTPKASQVRVVAERLTKAAENLKESKESFANRDHQNWLTPASKKVDNNRTEGISMVQVMDEETRMSSESLSRSQTPARNIPVAETPVNEESQGSVVSTATTESEKVKVKNRRMEINFDPDEGPFTVDKIAEYEWPPERKGETFMIQEQISQYLGVKSFKRKYPELKRRMVDMEERNYLRENCLVNESMCDMGLTAICSSEVLDIMCSDFPDHYEEYRKHMREKQIREHSKKQKELTAAATAEKNRIDLAEMAVQSAVSWNLNLNKARRETRKCSLDLQTFTIHVPKKQQRINEESRVSHYPVALIPGQYTDYYREYTPAELRYYPLNTVLYGPMRPNERKFDSQSEGSQSDSDSDSSSDDSSSCSSSEGTQDTEESQSTMEDVDLELSNQKDKSLKCKMCLKNLNKNGKYEVLIQCGTCNGHVHPSCIDLTLDMVPHIRAYAWQCTDCKTCAQCHDPADEDKMLFCDMCDRGYHIYCVGLRRVPQGRWHCQECAICASCGTREPGGVSGDRNSVAQWQHEYKKGDKNTRVYVSTLCVPCSKLWRKGRYCPHCSRCHTVQRLEQDENLVHCSACDKYLHLECVENKDLIIDKKHYQCDICTQNRQRTNKTSTSKVMRT